MGRPDDLGRLDSRPLYIRAQEAIRALIDNGTYGVGQQLPSEDRLAIQLGVSRPTIRMALGRLESLGLLTRLQGGGTFVMPHPPAVLDMGLETVSSLHPRLSSSGGLQSEISGLEIGRLAADENLAAKLCVKQGTSLVRVARVVKVASESAAYLIDYVPESIVSLEELRRDFTDSMLDFFARRAGPKLAYARSDISIYSAEPEVAAVLGLQEESPLLQIDEGFYTAGDELVDWSNNYFVADHFRFHLLRRVVG